MRILLVNYRYFVSGGPERYMFNVMDLLEKEGHEVIPFSIKSKKNVYTKYEKYFAEPLGGQDEAYFDNAKRTVKFTWDVLSRLFYSFHVKKRISKLIDDTKPDVAYVLHHYNKLSPSVIDGCKKKGLKVYVRLSDFFLLCPQAHFLRHGKICERCIENGLYAAVIGRCVKNSLIGSMLKVISLYLHTRILKCYKRVDGYICTTNFMKQKMVKGGWDSLSLHIIPTFVSNDDGLNSSGYRKIIEGKYILYFGRFTHEKGVDVLIDAYNISNLSSKGIKLVLIGGKKQELINEFSDINTKSLINDKIIIMEFLDKKRLSNIIKTSLFVVVPSRWYENLPNTVLESYAHGKTVIAMNVGSMSEIIENRETGLLFSYNDKNDLAQKLNELISNKVLLEELSENANNICKKYSKESHYRQLINLLHD